MAEESPDASQKGSGRAVPDAGAPGGASAAGAGQNQNTAVNTSAEAHHDDSPAAPAKATVNDNDAADTTDQDEEVDTSALVEHLRVLEEIEMQCTSHGRHPAEWDGVAQRWVDAVCTHGCGCVIQTNAPTCCVARALASPTRYVITQIIHCWFYIACVCYCGGRISSTSCRKPVCPATATTQLLDAALLLYILISRKYRTMFAARVTLQSFSTEDDVNISKPVPVHWSPEQ